MPISGKEMLKRYLKNGWTLVRVTGSHHQMRKGEEMESIPVHANRDLKKGLERALLKHLEEAK